MATLKMSAACYPALLLRSRLKIQGLNASEHMEAWPEALQVLASLVATGKFLTTQRLKRCRLFVKTGGGHEYRHGAIAIAAKATPIALRDDFFQDEHGIALGSRVIISAETFGPEPTKGALIAVTRMHCSLRRTDPEAGTVQVHFPRIGYALKGVQA